MICVSLTDKEKQKRLLDYFFQSCAVFSIKYPVENNKEDYRQENSLLNGKKDFLALTGIHISPWQGMRDSIEIQGRITEEARSIFYGSLVTRGLWNYSLFRMGNEVFVVSDFDDGIIYVPNDEETRMKQAGIIDVDDIMN